MLFGTSCSMVTNNSKLINSSDDDWKSVRYNPNYKYYFANNEFISVTVPELYEEVVTVGPLIFAIIPIFYDQYIKEPYNIHISTSLKDQTFNQKDVKVYINNELYNAEVKEIYVPNDLTDDYKEYISINMSSLDIKNIKLVFPKIKHDGKSFVIPELSLTINKELNYNFGFIN